MALDVYFREDILNTLLAAEHASMTALWAGAAEDDEFARGYEAGCRSTLRSVALAFGLIQFGDHNGKQKAQPMVEESAGCQRVRDMNTA